VLVGTGMVLLSLFALAVMHALLIGGQIQLDKSQREVAAEAEEVRQLRLRVAQLESPDRVLDVARARLGMVPPAEVGYLQAASVDIGDEAPVRVAPAERPAPDEEPAVGTVSPDRNPTDTSSGDTEDDGDAASSDASSDAAPIDAGVASEGGPEELLE
jgi:cell division protein FtsL